MKNMTFRKSLTAAAVAASLGFPMAYAQDAEPQEQQGNEAEVQEELERIQVTGSRIRRTDIEPTQPISFVDSEYISQRGFTNAIDAVTEIPGVDQTASPEIGGNTAASSQGVGQNTINIYGLGSQRTLTLINGSRFVSSNSPIGGSGAAGSQVDINNIPMSLIDRVEVVKVGGAAVYGADAVAGVVNYVLKDDYQGAEVSTDYINRDGITEEYSIRSLIGANIDNGRGNVVLAVEYNETENVAAKEVPSLSEGWSSQTPAAGDGLADADGNIPSSQVRLYPDIRIGGLSTGGFLSPTSLAATNLGAGAFPDGNYYGFNSNGQVSQQDPGYATGGSLWASGGDGLSLVDTNTALEGYERWNITSIANYQLTDDVNLNITAFSNSYDASNQGYQVGYYSAWPWAGTDGGPMQFSVDNPLLTDQARSTLVNALDGQDTFYVNRGWANLGQREVVNETNVTSLKFGLDGDFDIGYNNYQWELSYQKGWSSIYSQSSSVSLARWFAAMDVGTNPETGNIDCKFNYEDGYGDQYYAEGPGVTADDMVLGNPGDCAVFNPFTDASQEARDYVTYNTMGKTRVEQDILSGFVSGPLFELPAGFVDAAVGFEHRKEFAGYTDDGTGVLTGFSDATLNGSYDTTDFYGEVLVPLIDSSMGIPFVNSLSTEASYRTMDNSRSGNDSVWAVGLNYRPIEELMLRGNISETVRAPAVTELFQPRLQVSEFASDPCDARFIDSGPNPDVRRANCEAEGIPEGFQSVAVNASRQGWSGGNLDLQNEQADTKNFGIVYSPSWAEGLDFSIDWVSIEIEDAIVQFTPTQIMEACYDASNYPNQFCDMFERRDDYQLPTSDAFESGYVNAALREFEAYEASARYNRPVSNLPFVGSFFPKESGNFTASLRVFNLQKNLTSNTGFDRDDTTGSYYTPDWRSDLKLMHTYNDLTTYLDIAYHGSGERNVTSNSAVQYLDQNGNPYTDLPSRTTFDLGAVYYLTENVSARVKVENLTDWYPDAREQAVGRWTWGRTFSFGLTASF